MSKRVHFFEYIERVAPHIRGLDDIKYLVEELETSHQFETANQVKLWKKFFDLSIIEEFDESCLSTPIPNLEPYVVEALEEDGWFHEWELPDGYEPQDTYYDDSGI